MTRAPMRTRLVAEDLRAVRGDYDAAREHARKAEEQGNSRGVEMLRRHGL